MPLNGVMVANKPAAWTSHDVVARMRNLLGERSIGHLGTLDPMATGVLPLVIGKMTRLGQFYDHSEKSYEGTIRFGFESDNYDAARDRVDDTEEVKVTVKNVEAVTHRFVGRICQLPHPLSAKK